jgi:solute carrier family 13 (sodium-dependent dicarboxylate transporter), member 2/3/5
VLVGGITEKDAFASFGNQILLLFIGSFTVAKAFEVNGLHERMADWILGLRRVRRSPALMLLALGSLASALSLFISNTATTAMLLPIGVSLLRRTGHERLGSPFAAALMLTLTWGSSFAVGTPVATPPNLIGLAMLQESTGQRISFGQWAAFAMPISVLMLVIGWAYLWLALGRKDSFSPTADAAPLGDKGPLSPAARNTAWIVAVVLALWVTPDVANLVLGDGHALAKGIGERLTPAVAALVGMALCYLVPAGGRPTLSWRDGQQISWGTVMLFGSGLALGKAMDSSGLAKTLGDGLVQLTGAQSVWAIAAAGAVLTLVASELSSNTAALTAVLPVILAVCKSAGIDPTAPALAATVVASFGFMLPVSTAPNAIVYSSGLVPARTMLKTGVWIDLLGLAVTLGVLALVLPLLRLG